MQRDHLLRAEGVACKLCSLAGGDRTRRLQEKVEDREKAGWMAGRREEGRKGDRQRRNNPHSMVTA